MSMSGSGEFSCLSRWARVVSHLVDEFRFEIPPALYPRNTLSATVGIYGCCILGSLNPATLLPLGLLYTILFMMPSEDSEEAPRFKGVYSGRRDGGGTSAGKQRR